MTDRNPDDLHPVSDVRLTAKSPVARPLLSVLVVWMLGLMNLAGMMAFALTIQFLLLAFVLLMSSTTTSEAQKVFLVVQLLSLPLVVIGNQRFWAFRKSASLCRLMGYTAVTWASPGLFFLMSVFAADYF